MRETLGAGTDTPATRQRLPLTPGDGHAGGSIGPLTGRRRAPGQCAGADGAFDLFVLVNSSDGDPKVHLAGFRNYVAGAEARDVARFPAGRHGGGLGCGHVTGPDGDQTLCAGSDAANG
ncbi:hypothetical protein [Streptomyces virginiae]